MTTRGLVFLVLQLLLFLIFIAIPGGKAGVFVIQLIAFVIVISGTFVTAIAMLQLGPGLTPMPAPKQEGRLITGGVYKYIRHPIYTGLVVVVLGISLYSLNIPRALIALLILILFYYKSRYEEHLLEKRYTGYDLYRSKTGRFFPKIRTRK